MKYQAPKGMEDYYPEKEAVTNKIFQVFRDVAVRYGFREVSTPAMEFFKLLSAKSGEEIKQQIFMLEKRGSEEMGLRFDLTVPITRLFVTKQRELTKPVKWFSIGKMWRYEAPQKGRLREFSQLSVEMFGSNKPEADAELLNMIIDIMKGLGLTEKDFFIKINNRKLLEGILLTAIKKDQLEAVTRVIDKQKKLTDTEFEQELLDLGLDNFKIERIRHAIQFNGKPSKVLKEIKDHFADVPEETKLGITEMENICKLIDEKYVVLDLSVARGLAYYTGTVFEVFDKQEKFLIICCNKVKCIANNTFSPIAHYFSWVIWFCYFLIKGILYCTFCPFFVYCSRNQEIFAVSCLYGAFQPCNTLFRKMSFYV